MRLSLGCCLAVGGFSRHCLLVIPYALVQACLGFDRVCILGPEALVR
jgi:hypothetical protein